MSQEAAEARDRPVVVVDGAWCSYGDFVAVRDVSCAVAPGAIHALLGTNGAEGYAGWVDWINPDALHPEG